jgi:hypothetical protein
MADDRPIPVNMLPANAKAFVTTHFKGQKIIYAEKEWGIYECHLNDGTQIDFYKKGEWKKIDCNDFKAVPDVLIPEVIKQYVNENFPESIITKIEKERYGYDIELSNDLELRFNKQGYILRMDD